MDAKAAEATAPETSAPLLPALEMSALTEVRWVERWALADCMAASASAGESRSCRAVAFLNSSSAALKECRAGGKAGG
jgi:hypothetical protein